jgi:hypothetical protein
MICVLDYLIDTLIDAQEPEIHEIVGVELCAVMTWINSRGSWSRRRLK